MFPDHPTPGFGPHPWNDPFAPQDYFTPRPPDWAFQPAGPVPPPRPEDFPFTEQGRREYYQAVESAAWQSQAMVQQQMAMANQAAMHQQIASMQHAAAEQRVLDETLLLLI